MPTSAFTDTSNILRVAIMSVGVALATVGCSSTSHTASPPTPGAGSSRALSAAVAPVSSVPRSSTSAPVPHPGQRLSRATFVGRANAMCRLEQTQALRSEKKLTGLSSVDTFVDGTVALMTASAKAFSALVAAQPDRRVLQARWLTPRLKDYAAEENLLAALRADADRGNGTAAQADLTALKNMPNHDATVNPFLKAYGLTACA